MATISRHIIVKASPDKAQEIERLWKQDCAPLMIKRPGCLREELLRCREEPGEFISIAEESGVIIELGTWVINHACEESARWQAEGLHTDLSINVSARQLDDPGLLQRVRDGLERSGLPAGSLTLEITETALMLDPDLTAARLHELKRLGVRIAIDDFGTGYSSLAYLRQFPVDTLKIDRAFVSGIARSPEAKAVIRTLVALAKSLEIDTVAEGIDDERQRRSLLAEGCSAGQGFLFARPMDAEAMQTFLAAHRAGGEPVIPAL
jgi:EAL domain-containing protein (putative c-di-GMP-specific phosphodiesterase class I)